MSALGGALAALKGPGRRRAWRRRVLRRCVAAGCAGAAVLGGLAVVRTPAESTTVPVLVASRSLAVGQPLSPQSVRVARWPAALVPDGALGSVTAVAGRRLTSVMASGEPVTAHRLSGSALLDGQPSGSVAVHVALADTGAGAMVGPGDRIDLVGPQGVVARAVVVLRVDDVVGAAAATGLIGGEQTGPTGDGPVGVVIAAGHDAAEALARVPLDAMGRPALTLLLRPSEVTDQ